MSLACVCGVNRGGFEQDLGNVGEGKRRPSKRERPGAPEELPLVLAETAALNAADISKTEQVRRNFLFRGRVFLNYGFIGF